VKQGVLEHQLKTRFSKTLKSVLKIKYNKLQLIQSFSIHLNPGICFTALSFYWFTQVEFSTVPASSFERALLHFSHLATWLIIGAKLVGP